MSYKLKKSSTELLAEIDESTFSEKGKQFLAQLKMVASNARNDMQRIDGEYTKAEIPLTHLPYLDK